MLRGRLRAWIETKDRPNPIAGRLGLPLPSIVSLETERVTPTDGMELLTDMDRVRLVAGLGLLVHRAREMDPELVTLLYKLSRADTQIWAKHTQDGSDGPVGNVLESSLRADLRADRGGSR